MRSWPTNFVVKVCPINKTSQKYILNYVKKQFKTLDIYLQDLNYAIVLGFESFLKSVKPSHYQGKIGNNAVMKHI